MTSPTTHTLTFTTMIDRIFWICVEFLHWLAETYGMTYEAVNVWIFCVIWPALTVALIVIVFVQRAKIAELTRR